jgi:hypothetical protein
VVSDLSSTLALLGMPEPDADEVNIIDQLTLGRVVSGEPVIRVADTGSDMPLFDDGDAVVRLTVLRGPCYVALRNLVRSDGPTVDGIVLLSEGGRALTARDVEDVTGIPVVATMVVSPAVARAIDAGLFTARLSRLSDLSALRRGGPTTLTTPRPGYEPHSRLQDALGASVVDLNGTCRNHASKVGTDLPVPLHGTGDSSFTRRRRVPVVRH